MDFLSVSVPQCVVRDKQPMLIVMKFGGTSVGSAERISGAARLAVDAAERGHQVVVVTSAMSKVTDLLVEAAQSASTGKWDSTIRQQLFNRHREAADILTAGNSADRERVIAQIEGQLERFEKLCFGLSMVHELTPRLLDAISGTGELLAAPLVAAAIRAAGRESSPVPATELIVTTDQFGGAEPLAEPTETKTSVRLRPLVDRGEIPVVTGFIGATADGVLTTLGRGGSDYSASILGAALNADEVWIWTDVNGVMTANPGEVPEARSMAEISYSEASELAYYGAKVLHYKTILPAFRKRIPVRILNSFNPVHPGTRVSVEGDTSTPGVKAVTSIRNVSLIAISGTGMQGIPGIVAKAFDVVAEQQANVLMISQASSENNICFVISAADAPRVVRALRKALDMELMRGHIEEIADQLVAVVAAVGDRMRGTPGIAATVFGALGSAGINVIAISQGSSERNISLVVAEQDAVEAVRALHRAFQLERAPQEARV
jgi:bifunctional aspartokinase / homoserine dehydrogenase 1